MDIHNLSQQSTSALLWNMTLLYYASPNALMRLALDLLPDESRKRCPPQPTKTCNVYALSKTIEVIHFTSTLSSTPIYSICQYKTYELRRKKHLTHASNIRYMIRFVSIFLYHTNSVSTILIFSALSPSLFCAAFFSSCFVYKT